MDDLIELDFLLADIADLIEQARDTADRISGADGGRDPVDVTIEESCHTCFGTGVIREYWGSAPPGLPPSCPMCGGRGSYTVHLVEPGDPGVEGWPAFVKLAGALGSMTAILNAARGGEVDAAIVAAHKEARDAPEPIQPGDYHDYNR